jgi:hypothetical protein
MRGPKVMIGTMPLIVASTSKPASSMRLFQSAVAAAMDAAGTRNHNEITACDVLKLLRNVK